MGLFSSKKKTSVGTSVVRAIDDMYIPDSIRDAALDSVINNNNFSESLQDSLMSSVALRSNRYYKYGKDGYVFGSPSAEYLFSTHGINDVSDALSDLEGKSVSILFYRVGDFNLEHYLKAELLKLSNYNKPKNELTLEGKKYIITDVQIRIPPALSSEFSDSQRERMNDDTDSWFNTSTDTDTNPVRFRIPLVNKVRISNQSTASNTVEAWAGTLPFNAKGWYWGNPEYIKLPITFPVSSNEDEEADFISVVYKLSGSTETKYFVYRVGGGLHPKLDNITNLEYKQDRAGQFYPNGYYRLGKQNLINRNETTVKSLTKLHKYIGLDYEEIIDNIHSDAENVKDVEQAYLFAGVPALPEYNEPAVNEYLYKFFEQLHSNKYTVAKESSGDIHVKLSNPDGYGNANPHQLTNTLFRGFNSRNVVFALVDRAFRVSFNMDTIERVVLAGRVAKRGEYAKPSTGSTYYTETRVENNIAWDAPKERTYRVTVHYIKYQYQLTNNTYIEYQVANPTLVQNIYGGHATTASINNERPNLLVPIDRSILSDMPLTKREKVFSYGLNFVFNSRVTQKVKWYQRGIFKAFMVVVAVVITVWSAGGLSGISAAMTSAAAAGVTTAAVFSLLKALATKLLIGLVITEGVKIGAKVFGESFAIIAAVVTAAVAIYGASTNAAWTKNVASVTSNIVQGGNKLIQDKFAALQQDFDNFASHAETKTDELNEMLEAINASNRGHYLSPILLAGESPNSFYNRTINAVGRSDLPFVSLNTYYDRALTLPTVAETLTLNTHV